MFSGYDCGARRRRAANPPTRVGSCEPKQESPMQTEPTVRRARVEDYEAVSRLFAGLDTLHRDGLPWMFKEPATVPRTSASFADLLSRDEAAFFVVDVGDVVGLAQGLMRSAP